MNAVLGLCELSSAVVCRRSRQWAVVTLPSADQAVQRLGALLDGRVTES